MFGSTQIDKIRRNVKKYSDGEVSTEKIVEQIRRPLYCCITLLTLILLFLMYFAISYYSSGRGPYSQSTYVEPIEYSDDVMKLYNKFISQLKLSRNNPKQSVLAGNKLSIPENKLFTRTKTVQYLFDYVVAATKEIHAKEYEENGPNYHHIECLETFQPGLKHWLKTFEPIVREFVSKEKSVFTQEVIKQYVNREKITEKNCGGLKPLIGQWGVVAKTDIKKFTCIGHYYGDEYLLFEYEAAFPWKIYHKKKDHPFRKKWDYYMTIPYPSFGDKRLQLPENVTVTMDAYHSYNYADYIKDGGQVLTKQESKLKENYEVFVNDARQQLYQAMLNPHDRVRKNSEFVYCSVDGVLLTFLITIKDIKTNEQVFNYYGPNYG